MLLVRLGHQFGQVDTVASAAEAEAYLARQHPLLILMDVVMPGKDGFALCTELKAKEATRDIAILMLTDLRGDAFQRSLDAGADDYLPKQVDDPILRIRVHLHLHLQELRRKAGWRPYVLGSASILLATPSPTLAAQLSAQLGVDGHRTRLLQDLDDLPGACWPEDRLVVLDTAMGQGKITEALTRLRMEPTTAGLPVLLLAEKAELPFLDQIETMVDDIAWKPLDAKRRKHRLGFLLELGGRTYGA
jgi:DNA-binding response OmpR family regulator